MNSTIRTRSEVATRHTGQSAGETRGYAERLLLISTHYFSLPVSYEFENSGFYTYLSKLQKVKQAFLSKNWYHMPVTFTVLVKCQQHESTVRLKRFTATTSA